MDEIKNSNQMSFRCIRQTLKMTKSKPTNKKINQKNSMPGTILIQISASLPLRRAILTSEKNEWVMILLPYPNFSTQAEQYYRLNVL